MGCGWGALVEYAAECYGAEATGCTVSQAQFDHASGHRGGHVRVTQRDYRDLSGRFEKIGSVGMFEHVGHRRAPGYFRYQVQMAKSRRHPANTGARVHVKSAVSHQRSALISGQIRGWLTAEG